MLRGCLMFVFTMFFVSLFSLVAAYFTYTQIVRSDTVVMPSLLQMTQKEAVKAINKNGLNLSSIDTKIDNNYPPGTVVAQNPPPLTTVKLGRGVSISVAQRGEETTIPDLRGRKAADVGLQLGDDRLVVARIVKAYHPNQESDEVVATFPPAGARVAVNSGIDLLVSLGPRPVVYVMPDLSLQKERWVRERFSSLKNQILTERREVRSESLVGVVIDQEPKPGKRLSPGDSIKLVVGFLGT